MKTLFFSFLVLVSPILFVSCAFSHGSLNSGKAGLEISSENVAGTNIFPAIGGVDLKLAISYTQEEQDGQSSFPQGTAVNIEGLDSLFEPRPPAANDEDESETAQAAQTHDPERVMYARGKVNVRDYPNLSGKLIGTLPAGTKTTVTGVSSTGWYIIDYEGSTAYVSNEYLSEKPIESTQGTQSAGSGSVIDRVLELVNYQRRQAGLGELSYDAKLAQVAAIRARESASLFDHVRPNGSSYATAFAECGASGSGYTVTGENLAGGQNSADEVMNAWMNSTAHRNNILSSSYNKIGIAVYSATASNGGKILYWAQSFAG